MSNITSNLNQLDRITNWEINKTGLVTTVNFKGYSWMTFLTIADVVKELSKFSSKLKRLERQKVNAAIIANGKHNDAM